MNKLLYDQKIIILDINFVDFEQYSLDDFLFAKKTLTEITANQNLVILTNNSLPISIKVLNELGIKTGFLISDAGTIITNIANKKQTRIGFLDPNTIQIIYRKCIWNNLHFSINTTKEKHPYKLPHWLIQKYKSNLMDLYNYSQNTLYTSLDIKKCLQEHKITGLEIYFLEKTDNSRRKHMKEFLRKIEIDDFDYLISGSYLHIIPKNFSKFESLSYLTKELNWNIQENGMYLGIGQIDMNILKKTHISAVSKEAAKNEDHEETIDDYATEIISGGDCSWVTWLNQNPHLWKGNDENILQETLEKKSIIYINKKDLILFQKNTYKYLDANCSPTNKEKENKIRIGFWHNQKSSVIDFVNKNNLTQRKVYD